MRRWFVKLALLLPGYLLTLLQPVNIITVAAILSALAATCLWTVLRPKWARALVAAVWAVLCLNMPLFGLMWSVLLLDILCARLWPLAALVPLSLSAALGIYTPVQWVALAFLLGLAVLLWRLDAEAERLERENRAVRDDAVEANLALERKNQQLQAAQEENMKLATLAERSRIARDIHDSVGHLLARGMIQTGALMTINRNPDMTDGLTGLKDTLGSAMNSVRESVHDLHDESLDLYSEVRSCLSGFDSFEVNLNYDMGDEAPHAVKTCFVAVVREALVNISRHSTATRVNISLQEHPGFYQLAVTDNGTPISASGSAGRGMGLENMRKRAEALGGRFSLQTSGGYSIHITIPK